MQQSCTHCCTKIENLSVHLNGKAILEGIDLHLNCREILVLIGPNGAGKTTLLKAILGEIPYRGAIRYLIKGGSRSQPRIGYVPQGFDFDRSIPLSVLDLIAMSITSRPVWLSVVKNTKKEAERILAAVAAEELLNRKIGELSGGEMQRVLLAMAMSPVPDLLLLDEPMAAVDVKGLELFYQLVAKLKQQHDISIILVSHDLAGVAPHADRMVLINRTIIADGTPAEVFANKKLLETFKLSLWNISRLTHS